MGPILKLLYGAAYAGNVKLFVWLMIASALTYPASFAGYSLTATRYFRCQLPLYGSAVILLTILCWWRVNAAGSEGAAEAMTVAAALQLLAILAILKWRSARYGGE